MSVCFKQELKSRQIKYFQQRKASSIRIATILTKNMSMMNSHSQDSFKKQVWTTQVCNRSLNFISVEEKNCIVWLKNKSEGIFNI